MQNVISIWNGLDLRRRLVVIGATLAVFVAVLALARMGGSSRMELLYAGLDGREAGEVISALDQRAVPYEVRGDSLWVAAEQRDSLRMALAGEGLPAAGGAGYELLDQLTGFGTTSQMFDAAYWRAKEGELARTVLTLPEVRAARVHISQGPSDPFRRADTPSASVTVTTKTGRLGEDSAQALRHLVASAVTGLRPDDVQIIDTVAGLIAASPEGTPASSTAALQRAEEIKRSVERLLAARVGNGKAVVEVAVELITESEQINERTFDPQGRVAISSETEERNNRMSDNGGEVTVASNLPDGDANQSDKSQSQSNESRERVNYEVSETNRELSRIPGGIKRLTVAVLVDGVSSFGADGTISRLPREESELIALRELVASAVGLDEARGDVLTLKSMDFLSPPLEGSEAPNGLLPDLGPMDVMSLIQWGILALVALILGLFVLRPILATNRRDLPLPPLLAPPIAQGGEGALTGTIEEDEGLQALAYRQGEGAALEEPSDRLRRLIGERQTETLEILRGWLEPNEERA